jgi:hypothetical protein
VEVDRFQERAVGVRDLGIRRAVTGAAFFVIIGLISAVGTALVYGIGGYLVIQGRLYRRNDCGLWRLPDQPVQRAAGAGQCAG